MSRHCTKRDRRINIGLRPSIQAARYLPEEHQPRRVRTPLHELRRIPVEIKRHARQLKAVCFIGAGWIEWRKGFLGDLVPHCHLPGTGYG